MQITLPNSGAYGLLWVDLETTCTYETADEIIEIGAVLTDFEFNEIGKPFQAVIRPRTEAFGRMMYESVVREMHVVNGLIDDILKLPASYSIYHAERDMLNWLQSCVNIKRTRGPVDKFRFQLAGSGVGHFDRRFIDVHMSHLSSLLVFSPLDMGNVRRFLRYAGVEVPNVEPQENKNHRALDDVMMHLEEARRYKEWLQTR